MLVRIRHHALSIFFGVIFVATLIGQSFAGLAVTNQELTEHGGSPLAWLDYVTSSNFAVDVAENWQSEFLQFFLFILATIWLVQRGSPESKQPGDEGLSSDEEQLVGRFAKPNSPKWAKVGGVRGWLFANSLLIVMGAIFALSWLAQAIAGTTVYNEDQALHGEPAVTIAEYVASADFWNRSLQNWQSEFLAVGSMVTFSIFLRQRGSSESKPVGTPHEESSTSGE